MAQINHQIPDNDTYVLIRDAIAAILLVELPNQSSLKSNDPDLNIDRIWRERSNRFDAGETPALSLKIGEIDFTDQFARQRNVVAQYFIDVWINSKTTPGAPADEDASNRARKILRNVQYILDHPNYGTLNNTPFVKNTHVDTISPAQLDEDGSGKMCGMRLIFNVSTQTSLQELPHNNVVANDTTVKIEQTDLGYFYTLNFS